MGRKFHKASRLNQELRLHLTTIFLLGHPQCYSHTSYFFSLKGAPILLITVFGGIICNKKLSQKLFDFFIKVSQALAKGYKALCLESNNSHLNLLISLLMEYAVTTIPRINMSTKCERGCEEWSRGGGDEAECRFRRFSSSLFQFLFFFLLSRRQSDHVCIVN